MCVVGNSFCDWCGEDGDTTHIKYINIDLCKSCLQKIKKGIGELEKLKEGIK